MPADPIDFCAPDGETLNLNPGKVVEVEANKALIRRYYDELWNQWAIAVADEIVAGDIRFRGSLGVTVHDIEGFKRYVATVRAAFPDFHNTVEELIVEGDRVAARLTYCGTHQGELFGIAPTGRKVTYTGIALFRIIGGRIVDGWVLGNTVCLLQQLGAAPELGTAHRATWREDREMFQGELVGIFIAPRKRDDLQAVAQVEAVPSRGLVGDRYFLQDGTFSKKDSPDREVTLIEIESLEALARESNITLQPGQARRNLVTRGVPLNHLVDRAFTVGQVVLHGIRLCEPCGHLESLTCKGVHNGLSHRGGLRARIVKGGILRSGDKIV